MKMLWETLRIAYCRRFGQIAVERGYVTPEQLKAAMQEQVDDDLSNRPHRVLGTIFFEKKWMTAEQIDRTMNELFAAPAPDPPATEAPLADSGKS